MLVYGIQEHDATKAGLHYDLTLQDPKDKKKAIRFVIKKKPYIRCCGTRLAIKQKNHDVKFLYFQGKKIGNKKKYDGGKTGYGMGMYTLWDIGKYELVEKSKHKYLINIKAEKLNGLYYLIKMPDYMTRKGEDNWFFRKKKPSKK